MGNRKNRGDDEDFEAKMGGRNLIFHLKTPVLPTKSTFLAIVSAITRGKSDRNRVLLNLTIL